MELLRLLNVSKTYPNSEAPTLKNVNLTIQGGDFISIKGVSGSGKSTLLSIMAGISVPTTGEVLVGKDTIYSYSDSVLSEWRGKRVGYLFQNIQLANALTIRENLAFARSFGNDSQANINELLKILGIEEIADKLPGKLSGGQKRRAMIACVLIRKPSIILADEPTNDLDMEWAERLIQYLKSEINDNSALILVTHDERWADKATIRYQLTKGTLSLIE